MRLSSYIPAIAVLTGAALICLAVAMLAVAQIEIASKRAVERALLVDGQDWASVAVDGLQVTMTGEAPDEATRFRAIRLAAGVVDAQRVIDTMTVAAAAEIAPPRFSIEILRNDAGVSLIGLVPGAMNRESMTTDVARRTGGAEVADLLESADYPTPEGWDIAVDYALDVLGKLPRSKITAAPRLVEITSVAANPRAKRTLEADLKRDTPDGVDLILHISAPRPVISPFTLRFVIDQEGGRFDACSAHTDAGRARILAAAAAAGLQGEATCTLGLGVPSPRWADAVTSAIAALKDLGGGSLTFSDADVSLVALETTEQVVFDRVIGELESNLPDVFSLSAIKPEPVVIDGTGEEKDSGPPEFVATLSPEGLLQLRGRVLDERQRSAVAGFAKARFTKAEVAPAMRLDEKLPDGWAARVFAGLDALATLSNGALVVQPGFIDIRGSTGDPDARAEISRLLSAQLGEGENFAIAVNYVEALDPLIGLPTPEECVTSINTILGTQKVSFEPGSAEIDAGGLGTIDLIADVMENCSEVPMEIAGYTDSQGRESMNLSLSQQRAEAVLASLQARRVLTGNLTPKGYGQENPIADNSTEEGREANRRIEFTLIADEAEEPASEEGAEEDEAASEDTQADPEN